MNTKYILLITILSISLCASAQKDTNNADSINTANYWGKKAKNQLNTGLALDAAAIVLFSSQFLIENYGYDNVEIEKNGVKSQLIARTRDYSFNNVMIGGSIFLATMSAGFYISSYFNVIKSTQQQKFSFRASPVGASVAFRF